MNKENCALKLVDEIILYYDARSKKHQIAHKSGFHCILKVMDEELLQITIGAVTDHKGHSICVKATYTEWATKK